MCSDITTIVCQETGRLTSERNAHESKIREGLSYTIIHTAVFSSILDVTDVAY